MEAQSLGHESSPSENKRSAKSVVIHENIKVACRTRDTKLTGKLVEKNKARIIRKKHEER